MKRKFALTALIIFYFSFLSASVMAQGIYSKNESSSSSDDSGSQGSGIGLRGGPPSGGGSGGGPGGGNAEGNHVDDPGGNATPIGEGLLFITCMAGGYAMLKKRNTEKEA